jgi:hypothetical protein
VSWSSLIDQGARAHSMQGKSLFNKMTSALLSSVTT